MVAQRIKGFKVQFWTENHDTLIREYQDPEGWYVTDAGVNEDELGYYLGFQVRGPGGEPREVAISLTANFINQLNKIVAGPAKVADNTVGTGATFQYSPETTTWNWDVQYPDAPANAQSNAALDAYLGTGFINKGCACDGCVCQSADL